MDCEDSDLYNVARLSVEYKSLFFESCWFRNKKRCLGTKQFYSSIY